MRSLASITIHLVLPCSLCADATSEGSFGIPNHQGTRDRCQFLEMNCTVHHGLPADSAFWQATAERACCLQKDGSPDGPPIGAHRYLIRLAMCYIMQEPA